MKTEIAVLMTSVAAGVFVESSFALRLPQRLWGWIRDDVVLFVHRRKRARAFGQWPQALLFLSGAVGAGATLDEAFDHLAREAPEPLRSQVRRGSRSSSVTTESRLRQVMDDPGLRFARAALVLYLQTGGRVGRLLETTAAVLQERVESQARVKALTAQGRVSAWIVALTPFALLAAMSLLAPDMTSPLIHTLAGRAVLAGAAVMVGLGLFLAQRLAEVEA